MRSNHNFTVTFDYMLDCFVYTYRRVNYTNIQTIFNHINELYLHLKVRTECYSILFYSIHEKKLSRDPVMLLKFVVGRQTITRTTAIATNLTSTLQQSPIAAHCVFFTLI